jgi:REP element-mobilizing transposase RayT
MKCWGSRCSSPTFIDDLRAVMKKVKITSIPYRYHGGAADHLHAMWTLPQGDANHSMRWSLIKAGNLTIQTKLFEKYCVQSLEACK